MPSPAMAIAEVVRKIYGSESKVVFIGPCIAKKRESVSFDEVLTFAELRELFEKKRYRPGRFDRGLNLTGLFQAGEQYFLLATGLLILSTVLKDWERGGYYR
ncbi:MAG: [Fe-Fe] hydrogenase large subunit C-terminal domain-containing protein [Bacteroidales bacterium]